ncbi:hypothetical protein TURU_066105 [Turdus rufiventris]|nr:hypothetical protein TURU_066105 [Turdus rufiventris]
MLEEETTQAAGLTWVRRTLLVPPRWTPLASNTIDADNEQVCEKPLPYAVQHGADREEEGRSKEHPLTSNLRSRKCEGGGVANNWEEELKPY